MTVGLYVTLDGTDNRFDGTRAREHLTRNLAMSAVTPAEAPEVAKAFDGWLAEYGRRHC